MTDPTAVTPGLDPADFAEFQRNLGMTALSVVVAGVAALTVSAVAQQDGPQWTVLAGSSMVSAAASTIGAFLGFLFAIPKTLQSEQLGDRSVVYLANTNLEQISDWLTKILVGIGLVQLSEATERLKSLGAYLGPLFGSTPNADEFALVTSLYFSVAAFILSYLWTRALLRRVLQAADQSLSKVVQKIERTQDERAGQDEANSRAVELADRQISGQDPPTEDELTAAFAAASRTWLTTIFARAEDTRVTKWRSDRRALNNLAPVFRSLVAVDDAFTDHPRVFGSLGYVLKDMDPPDNAGAIQALTRAIEIRGQAADNGYVLYEWCRAVCRIRLDRAFPGAPTPDPDWKALIEDDLRTARKGLAPRYFQPGDPDTQTVFQWIELNGIQFDNP